MQFLSNLNSVLLRGASGAFAVRVVGALIMFGSQIVLARIMDLDSYGYYVYLLAWVMILGQISMLGFDTSLVRYTASFLATAKFTELRGVITLGFLLPLGMNLIVIIFGFSIIYCFRSPLQDVEEAAVLLVLLLLPVYTLNGIRQAILRGMKHVVLATLPDQVVRPGLIILGAILVYLFKQNLTTNNVLLVHIAGAVIAMLIGGLMLLKLTPEQVKTASPVYQTSHWIRSSVPLLLMSVLTLLMNQTDILMLGLLSEPGNTGRFAVAARISELLSFGLVSINAIAAPLIAEHYSRKDRKQLVGIVEFSALASFLYMTVVCVILILAGKLFLGVFGTSYIAAYPSLIILLAGQFINSFAGSVGNLLVMTGLQNVLARSMLGITLFNIALNYILIPQWGMEGAATATALSISLLNILLVTAVYQKLNINPTITGYVTRRIFEKT